MNTFNARGARASHLARFAIGGLCLAFLVISAQSARGQDVVQVEEDWQLVVASPDPDNFAPQVTCTMSPGVDLGSYYGVFDLNLRNLPSYEAGGMQLQIWSAGAPVDTKRSNTGTLLQNANETITWTQRMALSDGQLSYSIVNGNSLTWGTFGNGNSILLQVSTDLANLNAYDPSVSLANSGIGYASNRVATLAVVGIRLYSSAGLVAQDATARVVYPKP
jgi:hypothetical protein